MWISSAKGDAPHAAHRLGFASAARCGLEAQTRSRFTLHSDQGTQLTSEDWQCFLREHDIVCSRSRRGNCHDNAAMESFFQLLKRERIKRRIYSNHDEARADASVTSRCFTTRHGDTVPMAACPWIEFERYALNG